MACEVGKDLVPTSYGDDWHQSSTGGIANHREIHQVTLVVALVVNMKRVDLGTGAGCGRQWLKSVYCESSSEDILSPTPYPWAEKCILFLSETSPAHLKFSALSFLKIHVPGGI